MTGPFVAGRHRPVQSRTRPTEGPAPSMLDALGAQINVTVDRVPHTQEVRLREGYVQLIDTLRDIKGTGYLRYNNVAGSLWGDDFDEDRIWADVAELRARDPVKYSKLPTSRDDFEKAVLTRQGRADDDARTAARGSWGTQLAGGIIGSFRDPRNIAATIVSSGGSTVWQTMRREAVINMVIEAAQAPQNIAAARRMGDDPTLGDVASGVMIAGVGGGAIGGLAKSVELGAPRAAARIENVVLDNWDRLPDTVRSRLADGKWDKLSPAQREALRGTVTIADRDLPDIAESLIGRANMTVEERAAIDGLRREAQVAATSPYKPGIVGDTAHAEMIDARLAELLQPVERRPYRAIVPQGAAPTAQPDLMSGTSLSSGGTPSGARAAVKERIRQAESGGTVNPDTARNPLSSARGRYQFTNGTWLAYYKRRFGSHGLTDEQILAKRSDGVLQETLMDDLTADNARFLRSIGEAETAGNLYLTHFAGRGGAGKLLRAEGDALAVDVLGAAVVKANPWMRGMTVGDVIAWAHRKMREPAPRRAGARAELADDGGVDAVAAVQADIDRLAAEQDAARALRDADSEQRIAAAIDDSIAPIDADLSDLSAPPPRGDIDSGFSDRELALVPQLREQIAGSARLSDLKGLAERLEASEAEVRRALEWIAATEKSLIVQRKDGSFRRAPVDRAPVDAFKFLARAGGIADDEGHELVERFGVAARTTRTDKLTGKRVAGARRQSVMIPAAGPLVRQGGMAIDRAGEMLFEAGYLRGADGGRPTVAETLDYLEGGMRGAEARRGMVPLSDLSEVDAYIAPETLAEMRVHMHEWANYQEVDLTPDDVDALARIMLRDDIGTEDDALVALFNEKTIDALDDARYESGDYDDGFARYLDSTDADSGGERFAADAGDAGESGAGAAPRPTGAGAIDVEDAAARWAGDGADDGLTAEVSDSVTHDMNALHGAADDGAPNPVGFYLDENGDPRNWADIAAELDAEEAEIKAIRDCL